MAKKNYYRKRSNNTINNNLNNLTKGFNRSLIVEGASFSGKTTNVLFPLINKIIKNKESFFVLDSKKEYLNYYYNELKYNGYNTLIINLEEPKKSETWNPLLYPHLLYKNKEVKKSQESLEKMARILYSNYLDNNQDPFWGMTASDFFTGVCLAIFEDAMQDTINFKSVDYVFKGGRTNSNYDINSVKSYFNLKDKNSKSYDLASETFMLSPHTRTDIQVISRHGIKEFLEYDDLEKILNTTTSFNINEIFEQPTAIIFVASNSNRKINKIASVFMQQLYEVACNLNINRKFNFILDNFELVESYYALKENIDTSQKTKIKFYIAIRSLAYILNKYGTDLLYICDIVSVKKWKIEFTNSPIKIPKTFKKIKISKANIKYPSPLLSNVQIFDFEKYIKDNYVSIKFDRFSKINKKLIDSDNESDIEQLNKKMDDIINNKN